MLQSLAWIPNLGNFWHRLPSAGPTFISEEYPYGTLLNFRFWFGRLLGTVLNFIIGVSNISVPPITLDIKFQQCTHPFLNRHGVLVLFLVIDLFLHHNRQAIPGGLMVRHTIKIGVALVPIFVIKLLTLLARRREKEYNIKKFMYTFIILQNYYLEWLSYVILKISYMFIKHTYVFLTHSLTHLKPYPPLKEPIVLDPSDTVAFVIRTSGLSKSIKLSAWDISSVTQVPVFAKIPRKLSLHVCNTNWNLV